ncbi:hypothetical protein ACFYXH_21710 [Streptomyces sp. NPDC002730]|uniref:hypothetical protein n=1 Tax=Streptomyces sp. NPDC002730 TaxID=3364662 RepID=UPI0036998D1A
MTQHDPPDGWSPQERRMWEAYRRGTWCDDAPEVGGDSLRRLLISAPPPHPGCQARLRLRDTHVTGDVDLAEVTVLGSIRLHGCRFDEMPCLDGAQLEALELTNCELPGVSALGTRITQECEIVACTVTDTLDLRSLTVGNWLSLKDTSVRPPDGRAAIDAQSVAVGEDLYAPGLQCTGPVYLNSARIQDVLVLGGARINGSGAYLQAPELTVGGGLYLGRGFACTGMVNLYGASVGGSVSLGDSTLAPHVPGRQALHLACAEIGGDIESVGGGLTVHGPVDLRDTSVRGSVVLRGARFHNPSESGLALNAARLRVGGDLDLRGGLVAYGTIDLCDARVGGSVLLEGADLTAHDSQPALRGNGIETGGVLNLCDGFTAHGRISLNSVTVRSRICFDDAALDVPAGGTALSCRGSSAATLSLHTREASAGIIDLRQSRFGMLRDDPAAWPAGLVLDGAVYDSVQPALPARTRLPWLGRDPAGFVPQPYEQLAATCQRQGQDAEARTVLVAKHRSMRPTLTPPARLWSLLQDATVGYGYRPMRAVVLLLGFLTLGTALFTAWPPTVVGDGKAPHFQAAIYTLDLLLPLVDLGQERSYAPDGALQWAAVVLIGTGWLLATTVAAGAGRVLRRT